MTTRTNLKPQPNPQPNPQTLLDLAGASKPAPTWANSALVVIDAQQEYAAGGALSLPNLAAALDKIATLQSAARTEGRPIFHVAHAGSSGGPFDPAAGGRLLESTGPQPGEVIISKTLPNSFSGTDLHAHLSRDGITHLILVGFMTHMCVSSTARAALDLGYMTTVVADGCATRDLPDATGNEVLAAAQVHTAALAALADRFGHVTTTERLFEISNQATALA